MSTPDFSVVRRVPNIVDVLMPKRKDVVGYRLKVSPDFDGTPTAFTAIITANVSRGYLDSNVNRMKLHTMPGQDHIRAVFDPDTFSGNGLDDTKQFWMRFTPLDKSNVEGADSDPQLVMTPAQHQGTARIAINGTAPVAANVDGSLRLCLPRRMKHIVLRNSGGASLFVAFSPGGGEIEIPAGETSTQYDSAQSLLLVRGDGSTVDFSASFTVAQDHV